MPNKSSLENFQQTKHNYIKYNLVFVIIAGYLTGYLKGQGKNNIFIENYTRYYPEILKFFRYPKGIFTLVLPKDGVLNPEQANVYLSNGDFLHL